VQHVLGTRIGEVLAGSHARARSAACAASIMALLAPAAATTPATASSALPGQLYAFGDNQWGQLGNPTNNMNHGENVPNPTPAPVTLPGEIGAVSQAAVGGDHSLAITSTGQLYAFGSNYFGQLGNKTNNLKEEANPAPTLVTLPGHLGPVTQITAGRYHSLAVTSSGQLYAFGDNNWGQLGNDTNMGEGEAANPMPALVTLPGATGSVTQTAAGAYHSLAITSTGQLYAFGDNLWGQLGNTTNDGNEPGPIPPSPTPAPVTLPGETGQVTQIAAGAWFSLAVTSTGQLYAFGENRFGQLGNATNDRTEEPNPTPALVTLPGATGPVIQAAAGFAHSLALTSTGQLYAFGENMCGQLGNATNNRTEEPNPTPALVTLPGAAGPVIQAAAGGSYSLALTSTGQLYAFGCNFFGELGTPPSKEKLAPHPTPRIVMVAGGTTLETIATGPWSNHTLAVVAALSVTTAPQTTGQIDEAYDTPMQGAGGAPPYKWTATGLPQGLLIDPASGVISGIPTRSDTYTPTITLTDSYGIEASSKPSITISSKPSINLETPSEPQPPTPTEQAPPPLGSSGAGTQPPEIQNVHQSSTRWRESNSLTRISRGGLPIGTVFSFGLNEQARVSFRFIALGIPHSRSCLARRHRSMYRKSCTRAIREGTLSFTGHSGTNTVGFVGRISRSSFLGPGRYGVTISAVNANGQHSLPVSLRFTITP
jgi:alpha-tubulin suppressor-like RCC1 family protein